MASTTAPSAMRWITGNKYSCIEALSPKETLVARGLCGFLCCRYTVYTIDPETREQYYKEDMAKAGIVVGDHLSLQNFWKNTKGHRAYKNCEYLTFRGEVSQFAYVIFAPGKNIEKLQLTVQSQGEKLSNRALERRARAICSVIAKKFA